MATRTKKPQSARPAPQFYLGEWLNHRGLSDQNVANQLGIARETVWRWRVGQRQPRGDTLVALARILNLEPEQLWQSPSRPSLDALLKHATDEERALVFDIVSRLMRRPS